MCAEPGAGCAAWAGQQAKYPHLLRRSPYDRRAASTARTLNEKHFLPWREEPGGGVPFDQNNLKMRRQRTMLGCKKMLAYVVMRSRMCPGFHVSSGASIDIYTMTGVPMMFSRGTKPQYLLS